WLLMEISIRRLGQEREFRADSVAAQTTSPLDVMTALIKTNAYCAYRAELPNEFLQNARKDEPLEFMRQMEILFSEFRAFYVDGPEIEKVRVSHPFDTHPTLHRRLAALGLELTPERASMALDRPAEGSWFHDIRDAEQREARQWGMLQDRIVEEVDDDLA